LAGLVLDRELAIDGRFLLIGCRSWTDGPQLYVRLLVLTLWNSGMGYPLALQSACPFGFFEGISFRAAA
jgi:hypothetical protein